jgi:drug/metabolite transporter (DMT)-like permease
VSLDVLLLVLASACAHAAWNFLAKGAEGGAAFVWLATVAATVLYAPTLATGIALDGGATALMAGSGALHALYFVLLQRGYASGDLSLVYPLARGTGPLLSTALAIAVLGERPGPVALAGAALIVAAVLSLGGRPGGSSSSEATVFALLTGVTIAAYTLWDKQAVDEHELSPITYFWGTNAVNALLLTPFALRSRTRLRQAWATSLGRAAGVGVLSPLAYILVLFALAEAPVSYVAPARETSILLATLLGVTVLGEGDGRRRAIAAAGIVTGIAALAVG